MRIARSNHISVFTAIIDNEATTALSVEFPTNFVGSVRYIVHTLALRVNHVFQNGTPWQSYFDHVNNVASYFNQHRKASQILVKKKLECAVADDRVQRLKYDIPTRWHSRLCAMLMYLTPSHAIEKVTEELHIEQEQLLQLSEEDRDALAELLPI